MEKHIMDNSKQTFNIANHSINCSKLNYTQPTLVSICLNQAIQGDNGMQFESDTAPGPFGIGS